MERGCRILENSLSITFGMMVMLMVLDAILIASTSLYALGLLAFFIGLFFPNERRQKRVYRVSVVVSVRNEGKNIAQLLSDLMEQTYPQDKFEVIVVNDQSEDNTAETVETFAKKVSDIRLINITRTKEGLTSKKNAMQQGIENSRGEIILTTDGDCRVLPTWLETMVSYFEPDVGMVVGFSQLGHPKEIRNLFELLQAADFLSLMSAAQGALNIHWPLAASGQNLAYRREAFDEVGGFFRIGHRVSGDDVLLLQLIHRMTDWKIRFAPSITCFNTSTPESTLHGFLNQRKRWASNGAYQFVLNRVFFLYVIITFLVNLSLLTALPVCFFSSVSMVRPLVCLFVKCGVEGLIFLKGCQAYRRFDLLRVFPLWSLLQIPYVVFVGILGTLGSFTWKKRTHTMGGRTG